MSYSDSDERGRYDKFHAFLSYITAPTRTLGRRFFTEPRYKRFVGGVRQIT